MDPIMLRPTTPPLTALPCCYVTCTTHYPQDLAKSARDPFISGKYTKGAGDSDFGITVFTILSIKYQELQDRRRKDTVVSELNPRVSANGSLANIGGPYAIFLVRVLDTVMEASANYGFDEVNMHFLQVDQGQFFASFIM